MWEILVILVISIIFGSILDYIIQKYIEYRKKRGKNDR